MKSRVLYFITAIYAVIFFSGNAVRCWVNGHVLVGCLFMAGSLIGVGLACYVKDEADREKAEKHRRMNNE